jgi:hypothetical protein
VYTTRGLGWRFHAFYFNGKVCVNHMLDWMKKSFGKLWDKILENFAAVIIGLFTTSGFLIAITKLKDFQIWVRGIPTDYVLIPFVFLIVILAVVLWINHKQRQQLKLFQINPTDGNNGLEFITHFGVWWKVDFNSEYIEDFPYCPCCNPKQKLVFVDSYPLEKLKCPKTNIEIKLYDSFQWSKENALNQLYESYFGSRKMEEHFFGEYNRLKQLNPEKQESALLSDIFELAPFNKIPKKEVENIFRRFKTSQEVMIFLRNNYRSYKRYFHRNKK